MSWAVFCGREESSTNTVSACGGWLLRWAYFQPAWREKRLNMWHLIDNNPTSDDSRLHKNSLSFQPPFDNSSEATRSDDDNRNEEQRIDWANQRRMCVIISSYITYILNRIYSEWKMTSNDFQDTNLFNNWWCTGETTAAATIRESAGTWARVECVYIWIWMYHMPTRFSF